MEPPRLLSFISCSWFRYWRPPRSHCRHHPWHSFTLLGVLRVGKNGGERGKGGGDTGNIFFCYPLWLFRSHLIVVPRFQWGRPLLVRAWSCNITVQLLARLFPLPTRALLWSLRSEHLWSNSAVAMSLLSVLITKLIKKFSFIALNY